MFEKYGKEELTYTLDNKNFYRFFDNAIINKEFVSEDYYFCHRWKECGGIVYLATWFTCTHWGNYGYGHKY
jgi:hypothetical protein